MSPVSKPAAKVATAPGTQGKSPPQGKWVFRVVLVLAVAYWLDQLGEPTVVQGKVVHVHTAAPRPQDGFPRPRVVNHTIETPRCTFHWTLRQRLPERVNVTLRIGQFSGRCYIQTVKSQQE